MANVTVTIETPFITMKKHGGRLDMGEKYNFALVAADLARALDRADTSSGSAVEFLRRALEGKL